MGNAQRINRLKVTEYVLTNPEEFDQLLILSFTPTYEYHHKAAWILEFVLEKRITWLVPHLTYFTENLHLLKNESAIRPVAKICKWVAHQYVVKKNKAFVKNLTKIHIKKIVATGFDWLIDDKKVATQAYSMDILYNFGKLAIKETDWIHPALQDIILKNIPYKSRAYQARGRIILGKIG